MQSKRYYNHSDNDNTSSQFTFGKSHDSHSVLSTSTMSTIIPSIMIPSISPRQADSPRHHKTKNKDVYLLDTTFPRNYHPTLTNTTFSKALSNLKFGFTIKRAKWRGYRVGMRPKGSKYPFIFFKVVNHKPKGEYVFSSEDIAAEDWTVLEDLA